MFFRIGKLILAMRDCLAQHDSAIARLRDDLDDLKAKHTSLRGAVYARGIHKMPLEQDQSDPKNAAAPMTKDELRKSMGLVPGRPYNHPKE